MGGGFRVASGCGTQFCQSWSWVQERRGTGAAREREGGRAVGTSGVGCGEVRCIFIFVCQAPTCLPALQIALTNSFIVNVTMAGSAPANAQEVGAH